MNATYFSFSAAVVLLIASPGPIVALVIADSRRDWPVWTIAGGVISAQLLLVSALIAIHMAVDINSAALSWGQLLGGAYLTWLGVKALGRGSKIGVESPYSAHGFWRAVGVGLSNPKDILFFLAFLPSFIFPSEPFVPQAVTLAAIWGMIDITVLTAYSLLSRRMDTLKRARPLLDLVPGCFLLGIGLLSFTLGLGRIAVEAGELLSSTVH